jgi:hypothetical protein
LQLHVEFRFAVHEADVAGDVVLQLIDRQFLHGADVQNGGFGLRTVVAAREGVKQIGFGGIEELGSQLTVVRLRVGRIVWWLDGGFGGLRWQRGSGLLVFARLLWSGRTTDDVRTCPWTVMGIVSEDLVDGVVCFWYQCASQNRMEC